MSYEELSISLERLQRFNNPFKKYDRVYREIIVKHIITPKISLKNFYKFSFGTINQLVQLIWNKSVQDLNPDCKENYNINPYLLYEEIKEFSAKEILKQIIFSGSIAGYAKPANFTESDFICDENVIKDIFEQNGINFENNFSDLDCIDAYSKIYMSVMTNFPLNIDGFLQIAERKKQVSANIKRLIWLNDQIKKHDLKFDSKNKPCHFEKLYELAEKYRNKNSAKKPLKLVLLVEGSTEEVLLPAFSSIAGVDFDKSGIEVIASGGKNQVARIYGKINRNTNLPVFIILDADAQEIADELKKDLREKDRIHLISKGEFEDILPDELICRAVNHYYGLTGKIKKEEININESKTDSLVNVWKQKGFGDFKKAEFAHIIADNIKSSVDLSEELQAIILNIKEMLQKA